MTTIKQVFLGAAVAGVVAGTGSAVGAAVAYAEPAAPDTTASVGAGDAAPGNAGPTRQRARAHSTPAAPAAATRAGSADAADDAAAPAPQGAVRSRTVRSAGDNSDPELPAASNPSQRPVVSEPPAPEPAPLAAPVDNVPVAAVPDAAPAAGPAPAPAASTPAPASAAPAVVAVDSPRAAAAVVLTPAPAPEPVRVPLLPLLPTIPVVPVAPAGAVTVSLTSGTNTRVRAASAVAQAAVLADPPQHVLLIGTDGTNLDKILQYTWNNPNSTGFQELIEAGTTGATSIVGHTTISGPSWSTILTGVWDSKTGVINNLFNPEPYTKWPTAINMLEAYNPGITTQVVADWKYINDIAGAGGFPADTNIYYNVDDFNGVWANADQAVTDKTIALINGATAGTPTFLFSYQVQVDEAGHEFGGGSQEYKQAVINVGDNIAEIMDAVEASRIAGVDWTVIVTTDHGHQQSQGFGHGFQSPNETSSFIILDRPGNSDAGKQNQTYSNVDITPTIVKLFGAPMRSDFDGVPLINKEAGVSTPVDIKTSLNAAISMYGYPNIGTDLALGTRTVFATVPYLIDGLVNDINGFLQGIVDKDIFLISGLADITQWIVQFNGDLAVGITQAIARVVARLTGSGTIKPTDPPLAPKQANSELPWLLDATAALA